MQTRTLQMACNKHAEPCAPRAAIALPQAERKECCTALRAFTALLLRENARKPQLAQLSAASRSQCWLQRATDVAMRRAARKRRTLIRNSFKVCRDPRTGAPCQFAECANAHAQRKSCEETRKYIVGQKHETIWNLNSLAQLSIASMGNAPVKGKKGIDWIEDTNGAAKQE